MSQFSLEFQPIRSSLYTGNELLSGFDPNTSGSFAEMRDFLIYRDYIRKGGADSGDFLSTMLQSLHDTSITNARRAYLESQKCVAMMGGHDMARNDPAFAQIALLSRELTRHGFLVASGGGPGAMEASHLGAFYANAPDATLLDAISHLSSVPKLPGGLSAIVDASGTPNLALVAQVHAWLKVAVELLAGVQKPGVSLGVPTWRYGQEPFTPFASGIAKYFQNSIREDGLVSIGSHGIIFAEGKAGTIQEIFQNSTNNYYASFGTFTPMVFLGGRYWRDVYPVLAVLEKLFTPDQVQKYILVTDEIENAVEFIERSGVSATGVPRPSLLRQASLRAPGLFS